MYYRPVAQSLHFGLYLEASNAEILLSAAAENQFYRSPLTLSDCFFRHPLFDIKLGIKKLCNKLEFECVVVESCLFSEVSASRVSICVDEA